ncbi:hypothetical protein MUK42_10768 [Musa troglodytarum]|uniref:Glabrous enhancer-binding protein-like DBD domain-containing protein n=1 Tax=Musa troglodytarum TaxID=320322 RepID=A0A9E7KGU2_9LILI|nr:hypothetical protein MUK42_10768 [Musa troglodytarum]
MPTTEEAEQERAVFEDEEGSTSESDDSEDDNDGNGRAPPPPMQSQTVPLAGSAIPLASSHHVGDPNANLIPTTSGPAAASAAPQNGANPVVRVSAAISTPSGAGPFISSSSVPVSVAATSEERRSLAVVSSDESRRLFQRLWTDEEEIKILQEFLGFTSRRGTTFASHQYGTGPFYEETKKQLHFEFTKNQLIEKLRRLKKKYRNCVSRMRSMGKDFAFRSTHERAIYDIARNIWSAGVKRAHESDDEDLNAPGDIMSNEIITVPIDEGPLSYGRTISRSRSHLRRRVTEGTAAVVAFGGVGVENSTSVMHTPFASASNVPNIIEETVKNCLLPLFKELINSTIGRPLGSGVSPGTSPLNLLPLSLEGSSLMAPGMPVDDNWRKQQILELEIYLKRLDLVWDHIKLTLDELKSAGS